MKKQKLLKTLLVAAGLFTGVSAWADATFDFTNTDVWGNQTSKGKSSNYKTCADGSEHWYLADGTDATSSSAIAVGFKYTDDGARFNFGGNNAFGVNAVYQAATAEVEENNYVKVNVPAKHKVTVSVNDYGRTCNFYNGTTQIGTLSGSGDYSYTNDTEDGITVTIGFAASKNDYKTVALKTVTVEDVSGLPYSVNAVDGEGTVITEITSGFAKSGEDVNITGINQVVSKDGVYYELNDDDVTSYGKSFVMPATTTTFTVTYKEASDIVYFIEGEKISQSKASATHSGGAYSQYVTANIATAHTTLDAGVYSLYVLFGEKISANRSVSPFLESISGERLAIITQKKDVELATTPDGEVSFIVSTDGSNIVFGNNANGASVDYLIVRRTGDLPATETIKVTDAGMATYVSNYNLDFTGKTTKAYKVSVESAGVATLSELTKVPAKTPVLLVCDGGNGDGEAITITSEAIAAVTGNNLVAGTGAAVATNVTIEEVEYTNMILNNVSGIGFYLANGQTVAANRAYLHFDSSLAPTSGSRMTMVFGEGETTGISEKVTVNSEKFATAPVYNLNGQRVAQPTRGLYIVNGKKFVVK